MHRSRSSFFHCEDHHQDKNNDDSGNSDRHVHDRQPIGIVGGSSGAWGYFDGVPTWRFLWAGPDHVQDDDGEDNPTDEPLSSVLHGGTS